MEKRANAVTFKGTPLTLVGPLLKVGDKAPDFATVGSDLKIVTLADTPGKVRFFSVVPSLDTPVCSEQTRKFDKELAGLPVQSYTISLDLPFAQKRFCGEANVSNLISLSDVHNGSFGKSYGVLIEGLPLPLLSRAIFVVGSDGKIAYVEYVPEVASHPNYEKAVEALKAAK